MTRLFLRFYFGVVVILVAAWLVQTAVFRQSSVEANVPVIEEVYSSSGRLARDLIVQNGEENFEATMKYLDSQFDYPIGVVSRENRPLSAATASRLDRGESVLYWDRLGTAIPDSPYLVEFGPLPRFDEPSQVELSLGLGSVFLLTAAGIAFLLRPVIVQFRSIESAALAIAGGDLSARIDVGRLGHSAAMAGAFNTMADRVESLLRSQRELLQTVSHELRTPLARIRFATELIEATDDQVTRQQRIDSINEATDRLDDLVGELLAYVRLDSEVVGSPAEGDKFDAFDVGDLATELVDFHAPLYPEIVFATQIEDLDLEMIGHRNTISRAVGNLIDNAGKYATSRVSVSATCHAGCIVFTVDDDGPGIPEQARESVFEPFQRLDDFGVSHSDGTQNRNSGTGLGLALVKRIARGCGGSVVVKESDLGGARFVLKIPVDQASVAGRT